MDRHHALCDRHLTDHQHEQSNLHNQHLALEHVDEKLKAMKHNQLQGQEERRRILQEMTMIEHRGGSGGGPSPLMHSCLSIVPTHLAARHHQEQPLIVRTAAFSYGSAIPQQQPLLCDTRTNDKSLKEQLLRAPLRSPHHHHHLPNSAAAPSAASVEVSRAHFSPAFGPAPHTYVRHVSASSSSNNDTCQEQESTSLRRQALLQQELEDLRQRKAVLMNNYELRQHKQPRHFSLPPQVLPTALGTPSHDRQKQHEREYQLQQEQGCQKQKVMELDAENSRLSSRRSPRACFDPAASSSICLFHQQNFFAHQEELRQLQQQLQPDYATRCPLAAASVIPFHSKNSLSTNKSRMLVQAHLPPSIRDEFAKQRQLQKFALSSDPQHTPVAYNVLREACRVLRELPSGAAGAVADRVPKPASARRASSEIEKSHSAVHQKVLESAHCTSQEIAQSKKAKIENHHLAASTGCTGVPQHVAAAAAAQDHEDEEEVPLLPRSEPKLEPTKEKNVAAKKKKESKHKSTRKPGLPKSVASSDDFNAPEDTDPAAGRSIDEEVAQEIKEEHAAELFKNRNEALQKHKRKQENDKKAKRKHLQWKNSYDQLKAYKEKFGDCIVPRGFVPNPSLGNWVAGQRKQYKRIQLGKSSPLTEERIHMLEELGFAWDAQKAAWEGHFENLVKFHAKYGHCHVSLNDMDFPKLGLWVKEQRRYYGLMHVGCQAHMNVERIKQLEDLGFCWDTQEASWLVRFMELFKYKEEHGDCCPPTNTELGSWIQLQRRQYQSLVDKEVRHHVLTQERIDKLNSIGFDWAMADDDSRKSKPKNMSMIKAELSSSLKSKSKKCPRSPATLDDNHEQEDKSDGKENKKILTAIQAAAIPLARRRMMKATKMIQMKKMPQMQKGDETTKI